MKKVIAITFAVIFSVLIWDRLYFYEGIWYFPFKEDISCYSKIEGKDLFVDNGQGFEKFEVKGVNVGFSKPGYYATENAVTKEEYLRWFEQIQELGANSIRIYQLGTEAFYEAFYEYNLNNPKPLYLFQGVTVDEYLTNSIYRALDDEFYEPLYEDCRIAVDVIHGRYKESNENGFFPHFYNKDISRWVCGYIIGSEWENNLVMYTNKSYGQLSQYKGEYLYTKGASNFEIFLAILGDQIISYESNKYGTQKIISFTNSSATDPLEYDEDIEKYFKKAARVDVEHIKSKDTFLAGQFASYHAFPAYPDYFGFMEEHETNTYRQYLRALNNHHTMPVVIAAFGASSSRSISAHNESMERTMGQLNEEEQGNAIVSMYTDIKLAGCNGGMVEGWQDEWYKTTWNTLANVNVDSTAYWSDVQSCEQFYGLLSFDPGAEESICYVDGNISDWREEELLSTENDVKLYAKYDEKYIYFMAQKDNFDFWGSKFYLPIDVTPKSGSTRAANLGITMSDAADFVVEIDGEENSRMWVQDRYDTLSALFFEEISAHNFFSKNFPELDSEEFVKINMLLQDEQYYELKELGDQGSLDDKRLTFSQYNIENPYHYKITEYYETGCLEYGNGNPKAEDFNSLADFCVGKGCMELKLPWQLLNFADPVKMYIHDDYYTNYGVEYLAIDSICIGAGAGDKEIQMEALEMVPLGKEPSYHERLKESYYILQRYWRKNR